LVYHGQIDQDRLINEHLTHDMREGVFVDIGAYDGVQFSNSLFFERELGWRGVCIEANPQVFAALSSNRPLARNFNVAAGASAGESEFVVVEGSAMLSGFPSGIDDERVRRETAINGGKSRTIMVPVRRVDELLAELGIHEVHYLSLDVEGAEMDVLDGLDFDKVLVHSMSIEANTRAHRDVLRRRLSKRFIYAGRSDFETFFVHRQGEFAKKAKSLATKLKGPWLKRQFKRIARMLRTKP
jgi:FkbM family methyltransferase